MTGLVACLASSPVRGLADAVVRGTGATRGGLTRTPLASVLAERGQRGRAGLERRAHAVLTMIVREVVDAFLATTDLTVLVRQHVDIDTLAAELDVDAVVARVDLDAAVARVDLDAVVARVDVDAVVRRIDPDDAAAGLDFDGLVATVDLDAVAKRIDLDSLVARVDPNPRSRGSTSTLRWLGRPRAHLWPSAAR
jgi:hypothetical protein